jgi:hypothetical protein
MFKYYNLQKKIHKYISYNFVKICTNINFISIRNDELYVLIYYLKIK